MHAPDRDPTRSVVRLRAARPLALEAGRIDHALLRADATQADVERMLGECAELGLRAAVLQPVWIPVAVRALSPTRVQVIAALDLPLGGGTTATVVRAAAEARQAGASEVEVMTKVGWLRSAMDIAYRMHLAAVVQGSDAPVRAVLEVGALSRGELALAVELCADAGVEGLVSSSGVDGSSPSEDAVRLLVERSAGRMPVTAAGGISDRRTAVGLLAAGADLLRTDAGPALLAAATSGP
jgi:deoxyribose-phosphate aldolase